MKEFFRGWRRKVGAATLTRLLACVFSADSDTNLTMKVYTNLRLSDVALDVNKLPEFPVETPQILRATGTTDQ